MPKNVPKIQTTEYQLYMKFYFYLNVKKLDSEVSENVTLHKFMNKRSIKSVIV
jgi:hypothetical protein